MYKVKDVCIDFPNRGYTRNAKIVRIIDGVEHLCCFVELWSHSCCGLNTLHCFQHGWTPGEDFIKWLNTQPFGLASGYPCKLFTLVLKVGNLLSFTNNYCTPVFPFKNHAHASDLLCLYVLDLTKHADV